VRGAAPIGYCSGVLPRLLPERFYRRDALEVAHDLIGALLVRDEVVLRVTEVEAYRKGGDTACHARAGRTARNAPMWGPPGRAYIYLCYGLHQMLNLVTDPEGVASAVLVRSAEVVAGAETVLARRRWEKGLVPALLTGPGRVAQALGLDGSFNGHVLFARGGLEVRAPMNDGARAIAVGPRVGIDYAAPEHRLAPWRVADAGSPWVSERRTLSPLTGRAPAPLTGAPGSASDRPPRRGASRGSGTARRRPSG
jgi:DNA-3-methyladenine glycosylase